LLHESNLTTKKQTCRARLLALLSFLSRKKKEGGRKQQQALGATNPAQMVLAVEPRTDHFTRLFFT
jgi:hypothetical protein